MLEVISGQGRPDELKPCLQTPQLRLYDELGRAGVVCRRCGISRPTLRKGWRRYLAEGEYGLADRSRRPHTSPNRKVGPQEVALILAVVGAAKSMVAERKEISVYYRTVERQFMSALAQY